MSSVRVHHLGPSQYSAEVHEGQELRTSHKVTVSPLLLDELGIVDADTETETALVRESMDFLLDRETAAAIPHDIDLEDLRNQYPDYLEEISTRLS